MNSQFERTRLAWRRTMLAVLAVGGLGAVHLALAGMPIAAALAGLVAVLACVPALRRLGALRAGRADLGWEPWALTGAACLLASAVLVAG